MRRHADESVSYAGLLNHIRNARGVGSPSFDKAAILAYSPRYPNRGFTDVGCPNPNLESKPIRITP